VDKKEELMENERHLLKELGFGFSRISSDNVNKWLLAIAKKIFNLIPASGEKKAATNSEKRLIQKAWNYVNDVYLTKAVVCFPPQTLAASCLHLAAA